MSPEQPIACLSIGSSDSSGGAGIQGDVRAFASVGCFASTVLVGVTAQNTQGVLRRFEIPLGVVAEQLDAVLGDLPVRAIKIGTTWSPKLMTFLAERLRDLRIPLVLDPVMVTAAGSKLGGDRSDVISVLVSGLLPLATVVTPNREEAKLLLGVTSDEIPTRELAEGLLRLGVRAVVVSSSEADGDEWYADGSTSRAIEGVRYRVDAEHGVGCAHSAILAGLLGRGWRLYDALLESRRRAAAGVKGGLVHLGGGRHPVDVLGLHNLIPRSAP